MINIVQRLFCLLIAFSVVLCDQWSKTWMITHLLPYHPNPIFPGLNFTLAFNTGSAFSFLASSGSWHHWFLLVFGLLVCVGLSIWLWCSVNVGWLRLVLVSLLLGGAIGNIIDRLRWGHVIDFIDCYVKQYHWPVFNVADSAIVIAAVLIALTYRA